jgi:hypothetical protein
MGIWLLWRNRANPISKFLLACEIGLFISIPFLPPIDAGIRPYAGTIAVVFLPLIFVFSRLPYQSNQVFSSNTPSMPIVATYSLALLLLLTSIVGGPLVQVTAQSTFPQIPTCQPGMTPINFKLTRGSYILFSSNQKTDVPIVSLNDIHPSLDDFPYGDFAVLLRRIKRPALVTTVDDLSTGSGWWIIAPPELKNRESQIISGCGEVVPSRYPFMVIRTDS